METFLASPFYTYYVYAFVIGFVLFVAYAIFHLTFKGEAKEAKLARMNERLRQLGVLFRTNENSGVIAICGEGEFQEALKAYMDNIGTGQGQHAPWDKVRAQVYPTFTFASVGDDLRPAHTGHRSQLIQIGHELLEKLTGEDLAGLNSREIDELMSIISVRDGRLFVPFVGEVKGVRMAEIYHFYGQTTLDQARERILGWS
jgi:hypothetical protein